MAGASAAASGNPFGFSDAARRISDQLRQAIVDGHGGRFMAFALADGRSDGKTYEQRRDAGSVPGAIVLDRTVFEWRLDPSSPSRIPQATSHQVRLIVICAQGFSSSLAAASLLDLGLTNATDVIGGFEAWKAAGLPVERG